MVRAYTTLKYVYANLYVKLRSLCAVVELNAYRRHVNACNAFLYLNPKNILIWFISVYPI